jgi:phosphate transport system substrate-binding protein
VQPITSLVAEAFSDRNPRAAVSVDGPGTGDGFQLFCDGETDISDASRPIEDEEAAACAAAGVEYVELKIGIDGLSLVTSADGPTDDEGRT